LKSHDLGFLFLFTYVYTYRFLGKLIEWFFIYHCFMYFYALDSIRIDEQHKNEYNFGSASPILMKLVSIRMFSRMGFLNMQFKFT